MESEWDYRRKRLFEIIEIGLPGDVASQVYDAFNILSIVINLVVSVMYTFDDLHAKFGPWLVTVEAITVAFFALDYCLRLWTAKFLRPSLSEPKAVLRYIFSFSGLVDLLSFLPYYLPVFFPSGAVAFRMFRVARVFRLFRVNAYYDSLGVITEVISSKRQQLFSSVFILLVLMLASSLCMYSLEHEAQPQVFTNAFSGIWWSVSTLLTIGYGDIYPVTTMGKLFSIVITFLGVGMVAIPTGIISAGFVDQYTRIKRISEYGTSSDVHFICVHLTQEDTWAGRAIRELGLPEGIIVAAVQRGRETLVPRGGTVLRSGDSLVLGAGSYREDGRIELQEITLQPQNPWVGSSIRDLDISRQTLIVMVRRRGQTLSPNGGLVLLAGDQVLLYKQHHKTENTPL